MGSKGWERVGASTGILFVALFLVAFGSEVKDFPASGTASAEEISAFIDQNRSRIGLATVTYSLGWIAFVWFLGSLRTALARGETTQRLTSVAFGTGLLTAGLFLAGTALQSEIIFADLSTADEVTALSQWAMFDASGGFFGTTPFLRAGFVGAASLVAIRSDGLPRWLGWAGLLVALVNVGGGFDYLAPLGRSFTGHALADLFAFLAWILLASGVLVFRPEGTAPPREGIAPR